jgi:hypothetical protein
MGFIIVLGSLLFVFLSLQAQDLTVPEEPKTALLSLEDTLALDEGLSFEKVEIGENSEEVLHEKARQLAEYPDFQALVDAMIDQNANEHLGNYIRSQVYLMASYLVIFATAVILSPVAPGFIADKSTSLGTLVEYIVKPCVFGIVPLSVASFQSAALYKLGQTHLSTKELDPQNLQDLLQYQEKLSYVNYYKSLISFFNYMIPVYFIPVIISTFLVNMEKDARVYNALNPLNIPLVNSIRSYETYKNNLFWAMFFLQGATITTSFVWYVPASSSNPSNSSSNQWNSTSNP